MLCTYMYRVHVFNTVKPVLCDLPKGILKLGHIRQVVAKYRLNKYEIDCEGKLKFR